MMHRGVLLFITLFVFVATVACADWPSALSSETGSSFDGDIAINPVTNQPAIASWAFVGDAIRVTYSEFDGYNWPQSPEVVFEVSDDNYPTHELRWPEAGVTLAFTPEGNPAVAFAWKAKWDNSTQYAMYLYYAVREGTAWQPSQFVAGWSLAGGDTQMDPDCINYHFNDLQLYYKRIVRLDLGFLGSLPYIAFAMNWSRSDYDPATECGTLDNWRVGIWKFDPLQGWTNATRAEFNGQNLQPGSYIVNAVTDDKWSDKIVFTTPNGVFYTTVTSGGLSVPIQVPNAYKAYAFAIDPITNTPSILVKPTNDTYWKLAKLVGSTFSTVTVPYLCNGEGDLAINGDGQAIVVYTTSIDEMIARLQTGVSQWTQIGPNVSENCNTMDSPRLAIDPVSKMPRILERGSCLLLEPPRLPIRLQVNGSFVSEGIVMVGQDDGTGGNFMPVPVLQDAAPYYTQYVSMIPANTPGHVYKVSASVSGYQTNQVLVPTSLNGFNCVNAVTVSFDEDDGCGVAANPDRPVQWFSMTVPALIALGLLLLRASFVFIHRKFAPQVK